LLTRSISDAERRLDADSAFIAGARVFMSAFLPGEKTPYTPTGPGSDASIPAAEQAVANAERSRAPAFPELLRDAGSAVRKGRSP
jgi:hypothetical protein